MILNARFLVVSTIFLEEVGTSVQMWTKKVRMYIEYISVKGIANRESSFILGSQFKVQLKIKLCALKTNSSESPIVK